MSNSYSQLGYSTGEFQALQPIVLVVFDSLTHSLIIFSSFPEIQQFLEDTLKEETLGGASNAQKNILISRITDFKKDHPDLQGAKEIARREVAPTIKRDKKDKKDKKDKRYTQDPTLKKGR